jgi:hypothetical protein
MAYFPSIARKIGGLLGGESFIGASDQGLRSKNIALHIFTLATWDVTTRHYISSQRRAMEVNELRECPIFQARQLLYERFTNVSRPFVECFDGYILDDLHLTFTHQIELSTLEAWLVDTGGDITAMFSVILQGVKAHVLLDGVHDYSEGATLPNFTAISVTSSDEMATFNLARRIEALVTSRSKILEIANNQCEGVNE